MKDKEQVFYAGLHEPNELRKDLLLSQKAILDSLKKHEHIKSLRAEKDLRINELKKMLMGLRLVTNQLKSCLPASPIRQKPQQQEAPVRPVSAPVKKQAQVRKTKLQVLEDELSRIETKLSSLE